MNRCRRATTYGTYLGSKLVHVIPVPLPTPSEGVARKVCPRESAQTLARVTALPIEARVLVACRFPNIQIGVVLVEFVVESVVVVSSIVQRFHRRAGRENPNDGASEAAFGTALRGISIYELGKGGANLAI
jgi:hypothetical protein